MFLIGVSAMQRVKLERHLKMKYDEMFTNEINHLPEVTASREDI
jgi:hypothetical protein